MTLRWCIVRLVWFREIVDQVRDRRTLFMLVFVPLLLYPGLAFLMSRVALLFAEQPVTVALSGPLDFLRGQGLPPLIELAGDKSARFRAELFDNREEQKLVRIVLAEEDEASQLVQRGEVDLVVIFDRQALDRLRAGERTPVRFRLRKESPVQIRAAGQQNVAAASQPDEPLLNSTDDRARMAFVRVRDVLRAWEKSIVASRLRERGLPAEFHRPLVLPRLEHKSERLWSRLFPFLIVMMSLTGALYPAIDLCAGEKERGTLETLLVSPASSAEIVWGKFLTVWTFSAVTAVLNLASLGFTTWQFARMEIPGLTTMAQEQTVLPAPGWTALAWCVVLLVPLAAFFSAVALALAAYARSVREGQYYLMPLLVLTLPLVLYSILPGVELTPVHSLLPVAGPALLLQALMEARSPEEFPWTYLAPVLIPLVAYCYLGISWAVNQFQREEVLFREASRMDLRLWLRHLFAEKPDRPTAGQALTCFVSVILVTWIVQMFVPSLLGAVIASQIAGVAAPALFMTILLTRRPVEGLRLALPQHGPFSSPEQPAPLRARMLSFLLWSLYAVVLIVVLHPISVMTVYVVLEQLPGAEHELERLAQVLQAPAWWHRVAFFALLPALCEELAFRGCILSGLGQRFSGRQAVLISALLFAFAHAEVVRFLPTFILGLLLGALVWQSGSLWPAVIAHAVHNTLSLLAAQAADSSSGSSLMPLLEWLYSPWGLVVCFSTLALLLLGLFRARRGAPPR